MMISALTHGKCIIERKEDILTSSFFDTLFLLPDDMVWEIIRASCYDNTFLPETAGELLRNEIEFWPHWDSKGTENANYVEPDLFIRFKEVDLLVEAKRESNQQTEDQWQKEYRSYRNEFDDSSKQVIVIALDGIASTEKDEIPLTRNKNFTVIKTEWQKLYETILAEYKKQKKIGSQQIILVLEQLENYCAHWGMAATIFPEEAFKGEFVNMTITNFDTSINMLGELFNVFDDSDKTKKAEEIWVDNLFINSAIADFDKNLKLLANMEAKYV